MATYNLPAVAYTTIARPTRSGDWTSAKRLDDLAKALLVPVAEVDIENMKSIPDPWAQPLMFSQALIDDKHEMHASVRRHWRGMLALFGLQAHFQRDYQLKITTLDLRVAGQGNDRFRAVVRSLLPKDSLGGGARWDVLGMVSFTELGEDEFDHPDPFTLGMLSPTSLVATAKGVERLRCGAVPWLRNGLEDPLDCEGISQEQWDALAVFLSQLGTNLRADTPASASPERKKKIADAIDLFGRECRVRAGTPARPGKPDMADLPDPVPAKLYKQLRFSPKRPRVGSGKTRIRLPDVKLSAGGSLFEGAFLVDPDIAERTFECAAEDVSVWGGVSLRELESAARLNETRQLAAEQGVLLLTPEDLFAQSLTQFEAPTVFPGHSAGFRPRLLPISPIVLLLMTPAQIKERLEIFDRGDHLEVSLELDLVPAADAPAVRHRVIRRYAKEDVVPQQGLTDLALWPNIAREDWRWTFCRFQYRPDTELGPRFALSGRSLAELVVAQGRDPQSRVLAAHKWGVSHSLAPEEEYDYLRDTVGTVRTEKGDPIIQRLRFVDREDTVGEQHLIPFGADAIFFSHAPERNRGRRPAGCILIERVPPAHSQDLLQVAIDFGTTNTVVYMKRDKGAAEPVRFAKRVTLAMPPTGPAAAAAQAALSIEYTDFFPMHDQGTPFPTVVKKRMFKSGLPEALQRSGGASDDPGVSDNTFFMPQNDNVDLALDLMRGQQLVFQLKWSVRPEERRMIKRFLRQVMMMATAEAMAMGILPQNITWRFSYPQAFSLKQWHGLRTFIHHAWDDLFEGLFKELRIAAQDNHITLMTEGAAALRLFASDQGRYRGRAGRLILMLDIGGGTTELALYRDRRTLWRSSVKVAGGGFFTTFIANNLDLLDEIGLANVADFIENVAADENSTRDAVELFVSSPEFDVGFNREFEAIRGTDEGAGLEACASVALAGLFYYAGIATRAMIGERGQDLPVPDLRELTVAFAGRGSGIFKHLGPAEEEGSELSYLCRLFVESALAAAETAAAATDLTRVTSLFSERPKHEVAEGLLSPTPATGGEVPVHKFLPCGLDIKIRSVNGDNSLSPTQDVSVLRDATEVVAIDLGEFDAFLRMLKDQAGISLDIDLGNGSARRAIKNVVQNQLIENMRQTAGEAGEDGDQETEDFEPPFISALRALITILNLPIAERDTKVRVRLQDPSR